MSVAVEEVGDEEGGGEKDVEGLLLALLQK